MEIKLKETREELNIEVGDLLIFKDGTMRAIVTDGVDFASMCLETFEVISCWYACLEELISSYVDNPIVRVIPSNKLEIRELD